MNVNNSSKGGVAAMRHHWFSLQIRPVGAGCNLRCEYCNYGKQHWNGEVMSDAVLKELIFKFLTYSERHATFCWHGGEPTLAGLSFFQQVVGFVDKFKLSNQSHYHLLQTNAVTITNDMALFFKCHNFRIGVSLDGPQAVHDANRKNANGDGSFRNVIRGIDRLRKAGIEPSVIATVSKDTLADAGNTLRFLINSGFRSISYSPVFDSMEDGISLTNEEWFGYLSDVFETWWNHGDADISIRELNEVIAWFSNKHISCCSSSRTCSHWLSVEPDGRIYPCERYGHDFCFGNIAEIDFSTIRDSKTYKLFSRKTKFLTPECTACDFRRLCYNGCAKMRIANGSFSVNGKYGFCHQRRDLYTMIRDHFAQELIEEGGE